MIFGVTDGFNEQYLKKMASSQTDLKTLLMKYPLQDLEKAQTLLREQVLYQVSKLEKYKVGHMCKMTNFDDFYTYLQSFKQELLGEGLAIRMKKRRKQKIIDKRTSHNESSD